MAVGNYTAGSQRFSFAELSTGANQWGLLNTLNPSESFNALTGVSCTLGGQIGMAFNLPVCQAVGYYTPSMSGFFAMAQVWNALHWSYEIPAGTTFGTANFFEGVSCHSKLLCMAVGHLTQPGGGGGSTLAELGTGSSPHGLSLTRNGEVLALLRKPRTIALLVFKLGRHGRLLGAVPLGRHPKGRSQIDWNVRVAGHRLAPGTYMAELVAALPRGATTDGPNVTFTLTYPSGPIRVLSATCSVAGATGNRC